MFNLIVPVATAVISDVLRVLRQLQIMLVFPQLIISVVTAAVAATGG